MGGNADGGGAVGVLCLTVIGCKKAWGQGG